MSERRPSAFFRARLTDDGVSHCLASAISDPADMLHIRSLSKLRSMRRAGSIRLIVWRLSLFAESWTVGQRWISSAGCRNWFAVRSALLGCLSDC